MGARATNSHKLEMLDRPINTMFPVACTIYAEEKAWKGRRERVYVEGGLINVVGARLAGMEREREGRKLLVKY